VKVDAVEVVAVVLQRKALAGRNLLAAFRDALKQVILNFTPRGKL
jgi:hypothetical protein